MIDRRDPMRIEVPDTHDGEDHHPDSVKLASWAVRRIVDLMFRSGLAPSAIVAALWGYAIHWSAQLYGTGVAAEWLEAIAADLRADEKARRQKPN